MAEAGEFQLYVWGRLLGVKVKHGEEVEQLLSWGAQSGKPLSRSVLARTLMAKSDGKSSGSPLLEVSPSLSSPTLESQYCLQVAATTQLQDLCCPC